NCATDADLALRLFGFATNRCSEPVDNVAFFQSDYSTIASRHAKVSDVRSTLVQDALIRSLHMSVRAVHDGNSSVEKPTHRDFFGGCLCVHIDDADLHVLG